MKMIYFLFIFFISINVFAQSKTKSEINRETANQGRFLYIVDSDNNDYKALTSYTYSFTDSVSNTATEGDSINFGITRLTYLDVGAGAEGTTISFKTWSPDLSAWVPIHDSSGLVSYTIGATANRFIFSDAIWRGISTIKAVVSAQTGRLDLYWGTIVY